jgi:hypothetical protein
LWLAAHLPFRFCCACFSLIHVVLFGNVIKTGKVKASSGTGK